MKAMLWLLLALGALGALGALARDSPIADTAPLTRADLSDLEGKHQEQIRSLQAELSALKSQLTGLLPDVGAVGSPPRRGRALGLADAPSTGTPTKLDLRPSADTGAFLHAFENSLHVGIGPSSASPVLEVKDSGVDVEGSVAASGDLSAASLTFPTDASAGTVGGDPSTDTLLSKNANSDGFRMRYANSFLTAHGDYLVFEKTDASQDDPDGGIAFVNRGKDGVAETAMLVRGDGDVEINGGLTSRRHTFQANNEAGPVGGAPVNDTLIEHNAHADGFRMRYVNSFLYNHGDYLVFEKTDSGGANPDGGIAFGNRGADDVLETAMIIRGTGDVGIGTTSPVSLKSATTLQVLGNAKLGDANNRGLLSLGDIASTGANCGIWRGAAGAYGSAGNHLNVGGYAGIAFTTGNAEIAAQTERMRITSSGDVGIGTSSPDTTLEVTGAATTGDVGVASVFRVGRPLTVAASFQQYADFLIGRHTTATGTYQSSTRLDIALRDDSTNNAGKTTVMTLNNNGRVGIGTSSPGTTLDVRGSAYLDGFHSYYVGQVTSYIKSNAETPALRIDISNAINYYKGFQFELTMQGGRDWSGHGFATYHGRFLLQYYNKNTPRIYLIDEHSMYHGWSAAIRYGGFKVKDGGDGNADIDSVYLHFLSVPTCTDTACGWAPQMVVTARDALGMLLNVAADVSSVPSTGWNGRLTAPS